MARQPIEVAFERRGNGSPLVLLHGIGHRWQAWEPVLDALAERHDVIAVDLPGFGRSPLLPEGRGYDMADAVQACADIFEDMGLDRPHVAGNSLGAVMSLELASRGLVSSATALAPAGFWTPRDRAWALRVLSMIRQTGPRAGVAALGADPEPVLPDGERQPAVRAPVADDRRDHAGRPGVDGRRGRVRPGRGRRPGLRVRRRRRRPCR